MTDKDTLMADLDFAAKLARDGASTPLLGGTFFVIWSGLLVPTLILHGLTVSRYLPFPPEYIGLIWFAFGICGSVLTIIFDRKNRNKSGATTFLNRLGRQAGWSVNLLIFSFVAATALRVLLSEADWSSFNMILPVAFGLQALQMSVLGHLSGKKYLMRAAYLAGIAMVCTLILNHRVEIYYVSAICILFSMMLPGILEIKAERQHARR